MVRRITSLSGNGTYDWLVQRVSAVVLLAWVLVVVGYIVVVDDMNSLQWQGLFSRGWMRIFSLAALLSLCGHAWVGMWTVSTDYLTRSVFGRAAAWLRFAFQLACAIVLLVYFIWCVQILWSI